MAIHLKEISDKISTIDQGFNPSEIDETKLEQYVNTYFSNALHQAFPILNTKLIRNISVYIHPDKINKADSILIKWKAFLSNHPQFRSDIPFQALQKNSEVKETPFFYGSTEPEQTEELAEETAFINKMENSSFFSACDDTGTYHKASCNLFWRHHQTAHLTEEELFDRMRYMDIREYKIDYLFNDIISLDYYFRGVTNQNLATRLEQYFVSNEGVSAKYFPNRCRISGNEALKAKLLGSIQTFCEKNTIQNTFVQQKVFSKHLVGVIQPNSDWISSLVIFNETTLENIKRQLTYLGKFIFYFDKFIKELFKLALFASIELPFFVLVSIPRILYSLVTLLLVDVDQLFSSNNKFENILMYELWKKYYSKEQLHDPIITSSDFFQDPSMFYFCQTWLFFQSYKIGLPVAEYQSTDDLKKSFDDFYDKNKNINNKLYYFETKFLQFFITFKTSASLLNLFTQIFGFQFSVDLLKQQNFGFKSFLRVLGIPIAYCLKLATQIFNASINLMQDFLIFSFYSLSTAALSIFWILPSMLVKSVSSLFSTKEEPEHDNYKLITIP